jgi:hypothetical protein
VRRPALFPIRLKPVRFFVLALALTLMAASAAAQDGVQDNVRPLDLPVSLERIRDGLASDRPSILDALDRQPNFRVEVKENRPNLGEMFPPGSFDGGPVPPGGLYAYEQQRMLFPNWTPALFSFNALPVFRQLANAIGDVRRARAAAAARQEVERAMAEFCAAQPNGGEGVVGCGRRP